MKPVVKAVMGLAVVVSTGIVTNGQDRPCTPPSRERIDIIAKFVGAKFSLSPTPNTTLEEANSDCYFAITIRGQHADRGRPFYMRLFLTPDGDYLVGSAMKIADMGLLADAPRQSPRASSDLAIVSGAKLISRASRGVQIVVYSDFECPFCAQLWTKTISPLLDSADPPLIFYRAFPLDKVHPWSLSAAYAAECAFRQGAQYFRVLADSFFGSQGSITSTSVAQVARARLGQQPRFNLTAYDACMASEAPERAVRHDITSGEQADVTSVPTIFCRRRANFGDCHIPTVEAVDRGGRSHRHSVIIRGVFVLWCRPRATA